MDTLVNSDTAISLQRLASDMQVAFSHTIQSLQEDLVWCQDADSSENTKAKIKKYTDLRECFMAVVGNMPTCLKLEIIDFENTYAQNHIEKMRFEFETEVRSQFLKAVASAPSCYNALERMGLTELDIQNMKNRGTIPYLKKAAAPYDITVEHIVDLSRGGSNDFENLCLLPDYLNWFKNQFLEMQASLIRKHSSLRNQGKMITLLPCPLNGAIPKVPFIKGGYRAKERSAVVRLSRVSELFGYPIDFEPSIH